MKIYNSISFWCIPNTIDKQFCYFLHQCLMAEIAYDYEYSTYDQIQEFYNLGNYSSFNSPEIFPINTAQIEFLKLIYKDKLVILHEAPLYIQKLLNKLGIIYIVIYYSPNRFMIKKDNLHLLAVNSNIREINTLFKEYRFDETIKYKYVCKNYVHSDLNFSLPYNYKFDALLIGQTPYDMSLYNHKLNKFMTLEDYEKELKELGEKYNIIYTRHPLDRSHHNSKQLDKLGIKTIEKSTYSLLCKQNIQHIISISSSVLYEARYFFKNSVQYLYKNYVNIDKDYIEIDKKYITNPNFWRMLVNTITKQREAIFVDKINYDYLFVELKAIAMPTKKQYIMMKCGFEVAYSSKKIYSRNKIKYFKKVYLIIFNKRLRIYKKQIKF
ncbi:hypothetical protein HPDP_00149 [Candidatus Hepatincola sp. Pdp]